MVSIVGSARRGRLAAGRRRGVVVRAVEALAVEALADEARGDVRRAVVRRVLPAAFFVRLEARFTVVVVRRRVVVAGVLVPRAMSGGCFVGASMSFRSLLMSARVRGRLTCTLRA